MWRYTRSARTIQRIVSTSGTGKRGFTSQRSRWNAARSITYLATAVAAGAGIGYGYAKQQQQPMLLASVNSGKSSMLAVPSKSTIREAFHRLEKVLPPGHVTIDQDILTNHGYSSNSYHNEGAPNIVVFPSCTEQVQQVVKIATELDMPIIAYSGGTSLEGHVTAPQGGICLSFMEHMDNVLAFHPEDMDVVVQPGVSWEVLNEYLKDSGLFFPPDPGPGACIGGMVGTGCSGTNAVRYGTIRNWVLNLTIVLPDGSVIKTRQRPRKSSAGYDLTRLFIGSEGTLGIVTEATLSLAVIPQEQTVAVCDFPTIRDAAAVVPDLVRAGVQVAAVELLDDKMMKAIRLASPSLGHAEKPTLFLKFAGSKAQIDDEIKIVSKIVQQHHGGRFKYAQTPKEREDLWEARKICLWSSTLLKENASVWTTDVVVPVSRLPDIMDETTTELETAIIPATMAGHVGDGNFHVFLLFDPSKPEEFAEAKRLNQNLLERAIRMEGSVTGEHGVGFGKKAYLRSELGDTTVNFMKTIKYAVDPKGIMNPGKVLPDD